MGKLIAINISEKRGTEKKEIQEAQLVTDFGIAGDAHAGKWHRQVSLLSFEKIEDFKARGARIENGAFGENLIVSGFDFKTLPLGTRFQIGDALLEMTQIGKQCHSYCAIYQRMGECIMPKEGVFAVVLKGGTIKKGDEVTMIPANFYATVRDRNKAADTLTATVITGKNRGEKLCMMDGKIRAAARYCFFWSLVRKKAVQKEQITFLSWRLRFVFPCLRQNVRILWRGTMKKKDRSGVMQ